MLLAEGQSKITEDGKIECRQCKSYKNPFEPCIEYTKSGGEPILYRYCTNCRASAKPFTGTKHEVDYQAYPHLKAYVLSVAGVPKISELQKGPEPMNFFQMQIDKMIVDDQSKGYHPGGIISVPDKNLLIACSKSGRVTIWSMGDEIEPVTDFDTGKPIKCVKYFVTVSGKSVLAIGAGSELQIYEFEESRPELKRTLNHTADVKCFEYVPNDPAEDGKLVSVSADNILREWSVATPRCCSDRNLKENNIVEPPSRIVFLKEKGLLALNTTNEIALIKLEEKSFSKKISCPESGISMTYLPSRNKLIVRADRRTFAQLDIDNNFKRNVVKGSLMFEPYVAETTYIANQDESQVISNDLKDYLMVSDFTKETLSKSFGYFLTKISGITSLPSQNRLIVSDDSSGALLILRTNMESTPKAKRSHAIKTVGKTSESKAPESTYTGSLFSNNKANQTGTEKLFEVGLEEKKSVEVEAENTEEPVQIVTVQVATENAEESKKPVQMETETVTEIEIETGTGGLLQLSETTLNEEPLKPVEEEEKKSARIETEPPVASAEKEAKSREPFIRLETDELIEEPVKPSLFASGTKESLFAKEPAKPQDSGLSRSPFGEGAVFPEGSLFSRKPAQSVEPTKEPAKPQGFLPAENKPSLFGSGLFGNGKPKLTPTLFSSGAGDKVGDSGLFGKLQSVSCARLFSNTNNGGGLFSNLGVGTGTGGGLFSGSLFSSGTGSTGGLFGGVNRPAGTGSLFSGLSGGASSLFSKPGTGGGLFGNGSGTGGGLFGGLFSGNRAGTRGLFGNSGGGRYSRNGNTSSVGKKQSAAKTSATKASSARKTAKSSLNKKALASASKKKVEKVKAKTSRPAKPTSKTQKVKEVKTRAVKAVAKKETPVKKKIVEKEKNSKKSLASPKPKKVEKANDDDDEREKLLSSSASKFTRIRDDLKSSRSKKKKNEPKEEAVWVVLSEDDDEKEEVSTKDSKVKRGRSQSPKAEKGKKDRQKSEEKEKDRSRSRSKNQSVSSKKSIHETIKGAKELVKGIRKKINAKTKQQK